jgi:dTDP-glucose 4,6-dehydratase
VKRIMVTGGAGFIGSAVIRQLLRETDTRVVNLDKLTYAANAAALLRFAMHPRYHFEHVDICDYQALSRIFIEHSPDAVLHLAAESHVDRSIDDPDQFMQTNVIGTLQLLQASRRYWTTLDRVAKNFASFTFPPMKCLDRWAAKGDLPRRPAISRGPPTRRARLPPIIWYVHGMKHMAYRHW